MLGIFPCLEIYSIRRSHRDTVLVSWRVTLWFGTKMLTSCDRCGAWFIVMILYKSIQVLLSLARGSNPHHHHA